MSRISIRVQLRPWEVLTTLLDLKCDSSRRLGPAGLVVGFALFSTMPGCSRVDTTACLYEWEGDCDAEDFVGEQTAYCENGAPWVIEEVRADPIERSRDEVYGDDDDSTNDGPMMCCVEALVRHAPRSAECGSSRARR